MISIYKGLAYILIMSPPVAWVGGGELSPQGIYLFNMMDVIRPTLRHPTDRVCRVTKFRHPEFRFH